MDSPGFVPNAAVLARTAKNAYVFVPPWHKQRKLPNLPINKSTRTIRTKCTGTQVHLVLMVLSVIIENNWPGTAALSYRVTSRELVKQVPRKRRVPCPLQKKGVNMNDNRKLINIRVTEKEKVKMEDIAKKCGLSLSEYLRKRGLGFAPGPFLDDRFF